MKEHLAGECWTDTSGRPITAHGGQILAHKGWWYWFGERYGTAPGGEERGVGGYKSKDLVNWQPIGDNGVVFRVSATPGDPLEAGCVIERPKVLVNEKTGKFVMWFHHELKGQGYNAARAAVAIADRIEGPYILARTDRGPKGVWPANIRLVGTGQSNPTQPHNWAPELDIDDVDPTSETHTRLVSGFQNGQESRDQTAFLDDDGKAYRIYSSEMNQTMHIAELTDDFTNYTGRFVRAFVGKAREAPAVFKTNGKYYMVTSGCSGWTPNPAEIAVADSIWGPWKTLGNPWVGPEDQVSKSFNSQSTYAVNLGNEFNGAILLMGDRWKPDSLDSSGYVWGLVNLRGIGQKPEITLIERWQGIGK